MFPRDGLLHVALTFLSALGILMLSSAPLGAQSPQDLYQPGPDPIAPSLPAQDVSPNGDPLDMLDMPLEQLSKVAVTAPALDMEVSTVSRTESTVGKSPAAVFVVTNEMIRRSGATCIPEVLRMVPGLDVARVDSHTWMITSRGFSERFANKLLVLIDGRSVYTPLFSGVYWDSQDTILEDIERIEVIRGPGATIWGANAVNGVINIITKKASETQGVLVGSGGGNHDRMVNVARYGGGDDRGFSWRIYGKQFERGPGYLPEGAHDGWGQGRGGFRADWEVNRNTTWTVQGDFYGGTDGLDMYEINPDSPRFLGMVSPKENISGANVLTRWTRVLDEESDWSLQMYYDRTMRDQPILRQEIDTFDLDFQHRFSLGSRHAMIWGLEFRQVHDNLEYQSFYDGFIPGQRTMDTFSGFIQDQITL
ncbi:MAG: TonB-dependent receptor plug domain-containing protein, partial [Pirellulaceae bacterium]|nr:TonB-dependent receptor plug domain-containing protein [Pirellulaceae bacterium]